MVVAGLTPGEHKHHTEEVMVLAAEMFVELKKVNKKYGLDFKIRIGVHTGPVIAGVLGVKKFAYGEFIFVLLYYLRILWYCLGLLSCALYSSFAEKNVSHFFSVPTLFRCLLL